MQDGIQEKKGLEERGWQNMLVTIHHVAKYLKFASRRKDLPEPMVSVHRQLAPLFWAQDRQIMMIRNT